VLKRVLDKAQLASCRLNDPTKKLRRPVT